MLTLKEITDKETWEGFIENNSLQPIFFQSWVWGELERKRGKTVFNYGIYCAPAFAPAGQNSTLIGLALCVLVKAKRGTFLHIRSGPLLKSGPPWNSVNSISGWEDEKMISELIQLFKNLTAGLKCTFLRISPNILKSQTHATKFLLDNGFKFCQMHDVDAEVTWVLDLTQSEEEILMGMRQQTRYAIKKAQKIPELSIFKTSDVKYLPEFWKIYQDTIKRQKWQAYSYEYLLQEFEQFAESNQVLLFLAEYQGKFIAGSMFIYYHNQVFYHHSGGLTEYRNIPAMSLLHWESILEAKHLGCVIYNFFGIARDDNPKHPWAGLSLFKKGFGGTQKEMVHALDLPISKRYLVTYIYELLERKRRGY